MGQMAGEIMEDKDYKEKWLDILNINSLKRTPRAPNRAVEAMANASDDPGFVRSVMDDWKNGKIDDEDACDKLKKKFGETTYKQIEKAGTKAI